MSWCEPFAERRQGFTRRPRLLLIGAISFLLFTFYHITAQYSSPTGASDLSHFAPHHTDQGDHYPDEPNLRSGKNTVRCAWAEVDRESTSMISDKAAPAFPLLGAWLKPEAGTFNSALGGYLRLIPSYVGQPVTVLHWRKFLKR